MGADNHFVAQEPCLGDVAYGSADIFALTVLVRFAPDRDIKSKVVDVA